MSSISESLESAAENACPVIIVLKDGRTAHGMVWKKDASYLLRAFSLSSDPKRAFLARDILRVDLLPNDPPPYHCRPEVPYLPFEIEILHVRSSERPSAARLAIVPQTEMHA